MANSINEVGQNESLQKLNKIYFIPDDPSKVDTEWNLLKLVDIGSKFGMNRIGLDLLHT